MAELMAGKQLPPNERSTRCEISASGRRDRSYLIMQVPRVLRLVHMERQQHYLLCPEEPTCIYQLGG